MSRDHITVCVCTYRRPDWLRRLLHALQQQQTGDLFDYSIVVADNDAAESGREIVAEVAGLSAVPIHYCVESARNIALARNRAIAAATGDWIAFIDDDEVPNPDWLLRLHQACRIHQAQGRWARCARILSNHRRRGSRKAASTIGPNTRPGLSCPGPNHAPGICYSGGRSCPSTDPPFPPSFRTAAKTRISSAA